MAVRNEVLEKDRKAIKKIIKIINKQLVVFENPLEDEALIELFSSRYNLKNEDIKEWLSITTWSREKNISEKKINKIQQKLKQFNVIDTIVNADKLIVDLF
jgi:hypothetical protein